MRNLTSAYALVMAAALMWWSQTYAHVGVSEQIELLDRQIKTEPASSRLYRSRAELNRIHGHWREAVDDFETALRLQPGDTAAVVGLARTLVDMGSYTEAAAYLEPLLRVQPDNVQALLIRARARSAAGEYLASAGDYGQAIDTIEATRRPLPEYYIERAKAFELAGDVHLAAAIEVLDAGIRRLGDVWTLEMRAIELERKRKAYSRALGRLDSIIDRSSRLESLLHLRGEILVEAGRFDDARTDFSRALDAIAALPPGRRHVSSIERLQRDIDQSLYALTGPGNE